jgi:hypothetical protein
MKVELKRRKKERMMSRCFTWFTISGLGEPEIYQNLMWITMYVGGFYLVGYRGRESILPFSYILESIRLS